jgi:hypothetical protein
LQMLWIKRTPLAAAKTASIHLGGCTTGAVTAQLHEGHAEDDSSLHDEIGRGSASRMCRRTNPSRITGVSRALGWVCKISGSEVTPGPWRPNTSLSAEQTVETEKLGFCGER